MNKKIITIFFVLNVISIAFFIIFGFRNIDRSFDVEELIVRSKGSLASIKISAKKSPVIEISDSRGVSRIKVAGGRNPKISLLNDMKKPVVSLAVLSEGEGGFGLADRRSSASIILKGGYDPTVAIYGKESEPKSVFGVMKDIAHLKMRGKTGSLLLHGGEKSGMMMLDENGELKIFICKDGIFQNREIEPPKEEKFYSFNREKKALFGDDADGKKR